MEGKILILRAAGYAEIQSAEEDLLKQMQREVGGYIEVVYSCHKKLSDYVVVCNEDGIYLNLDPNVYGIGFYGNWIYGDILIMKQGFVNGEPDIVPLDDADIKKIGEYFENL